MRARILLSGSKGLIGSHLKKALEERDHQVIALVREQGPSSQERVCWDPSHGSLCKDDFEGFDAVIHLAGESIASGPWTQARKKKIFLSRCRDTWLLSQVLCRLYRPPQTVITASAIGFYGNCGEQEVTEENRRGHGFLADLCAKWEEASYAIEQRGSRVVHARFGAVLSNEGGVLKRLLPLYRLGLGCVLGNGEQIFSWISLDDVVAALMHILTHENLFGPINVVAPHPVRQREFAKTLAKICHRPLILRLPKALLRLFFKEMADDLLLSSCSAKPAKLLDSGYTFLYPELEPALKDLTSLKSKT